MTISKGGRNGLLEAGADLQNPPGPDGPPQNINWQYYSGTKIQYTWTSWDTAYETQVSKDEGATVYDTFGPGVQEWNSGDTSVDIDYRFRHRQGGLTTAWIGLAE